MVRSTVVLFSALILFAVTCAKKPAETFTGRKGEIQLLILDPGHFHATLIQKTMYPQISPDVRVYSPGGPELEDYLKRVNGFNTRTENPTSWNQIVYTGPEYLKHMIQDKAGNVMVTAGNNRQKTEYIQATVDAGIHVLADKPMCIDPAGYELLKAAIATAGEKGVLIKDIMTERHEITSILQRELARRPDVFGILLPGTEEEPAVTKESVHHFFKTVSGSPIIRPAWFFDVAQQGEGLVDVTTHLVDLVQWGCFPEQVVQCPTDIEMLNAKRWPTRISRAQFEKATGEKDFPDFLKKDVDTAGVLNVYSNGEMAYKIKGVHAKVSVIWNFEAPPGGGDTHFSIMRGSKANLVIRQGKEQNYKPELFVEPVKGTDAKALGETLKQAAADLEKTYPGVGLEREKSAWQVLIPDSYRIGHEAHFGQVVEEFLKALIDGKLPDWEVPNMIAKYYITTSALEMARRQ